jgi:curved DNA-binding protein CbpA
LAGNSARATVPAEMGTAVQARTDARLTLCQKKALRTDRKGSKTECLFADGTSILLSDFLASFVRAGDELLFPFDLGAAEANTEILICHNPEERRQDVFQAEIAYVSQPRKDKRDRLFVSAEVPGTRLGISAINLRCEVLRDYFYVANRRRPWEQQPSFYELLRVNPKVSPTEMRLAFKLRTLELRTARAPDGDIRAIERAFNILAHPELRACYDSLLNDPSLPVVFPYGGFGSLVVAGDRSRDGSMFYASRILSFLPERKFKHFRAHLRRVEFHSDHAIYRDSRHKLEVFFDRASLPLSWDASWNQWKHLLGTKVPIKGTFIQSGKYQYRGDAWNLVKWETALPSRIKVALPTNIAEEIAQARETHHRFGQFADALDHIRARIESTPVERADLQKLCTGFGIPSDFDVALISWKPDYEAFYYRQLCKRARRLYLFRSEYIYDLETVVVVETPQLGHATYLFSKRASMPEFLTIYRNATKDDIRHNRGNVAERLGFLGRLVHSHSRGAWLRELKIALGEVIDYAEAVERLD